MVVNCSLAGKIHVLFGKDKHHPKGKWNRFQKGKEKKKNPNYDLTWPTWGFLSSGHTRDSSLKAVYKPPKPPPSMHTLGFWKQKLSIITINDHKAWKV